MSDELKPCPFCGNNDVFIELNTDALVYVITCSKCLFTIPWVNKEMLIERWNTRPLEDALAAILAVSKAYLRTISKATPDEYSLEEVNKIALEALETLSSNGDELWVKKSDYDALTAERDELRAKLQAMEYVNAEAENVGLPEVVRQLQEERDLLKKENQQQYDSLLAYEKSVKIRSDEILRLIDEIHKLQKECDLLQSKLAQAREALEYYDKYYGGIESVAADTLRQLDDSFPDVAKNE